jgi:Flp pilus assembly protein CpaB
MSSSLLLARARQIRHRPALRWLVVFAVAGLTGVLSARVVDSARAAQARWGTGRSVVVVVRAVAAGDPIEAGDVEVRPLPPAALPDAAVSDAPVGRVAVADLYPGEVLVADRLAPGGRHGPAALLPPGDRALAVPSGPGTPPLHVGDTVDVLATYDPLLFDPASDPAGLTAGGGAVATGALVIDVSDGAVTVALEPEEASLVALALAQGAVTLALVG